MAATGRIPSRAEAENGSLLIDCSTCEPAIGQQAREGRGAGRNWEETGWGWVGNPAGDGGRKRASAGVRTQVRRQVRRQGGGDRGRLRDRLRLVYRDGFGAMTSIEILCFSFALFLHDVLPVRDRHIASHFHAFCVCRWRGWRVNEAWKSPEVDGDVFEHPLKPQP